jgi:glycosyltransferase involved in cell wall biosynthesis
VSQEPRGTKHKESLRVAFVAGQLTPDGAEKQLVYMVRALRDAGADVQVYCLTRGDFYEQVLKAMGIPVCWVGRRKNPLIRIATLIAALRKFRPHFVQAAHFFTNPYAFVPARFCGAVAIGCSRSDVVADVRRCKGLGRSILRMCPFLLVNSHAAKRNAELLSVKPKRIRLLENVIDVAAFDAERRQLSFPFEPTSRPIAAALGRLIVGKRVDCFLNALARARCTVPELMGLILGDGPERSSLERQAASLGLLPDNIEFLGHRSDVPALLEQAALLVHSSAHEGFPNAVLEAMTAGLPVITTPAGDAGVVVQDGVTGYVVPFDDVEHIAERMVQLARSPALRRRFGDAGRRRVEELYSFECFADRIFAIYRSTVGQHTRISSLLPA